MICRASFDQSRRGLGSALIFNPLLSLSLVMSLSGCADVSSDRLDDLASPTPVEDSFSSGDQGVSDQGVSDRGVSDQGVSDQDVDDDDLGIPMSSDFEVIDYGREIQDQTPPPVECGCFAGSGQYCAQAVFDYALEVGCLLGNFPSAAPHYLMRCDETNPEDPPSAQWTVAEECAHGCVSGELPSQSLCELPPCDCFVRVAWCGASAGRHGESQLNCRVPLIPEHDNDILACDGETWIVREECELGCIEEMTGTPDSCRAPEPESVDTLWPDCPSRGLLASGLHPEASDRLRCAGVEASRISQTVGNAAASAGYHASDGTVNGLPYTAAVDLRTRDLTLSEIRALLVRLGQHGFAAWYRQPGSDGWPSDQAPHIHAVFAGVRMKSQLRGQVRDFLENKNGLSSHRVYQFWTIPEEIKALIEQLFRRNYSP